MFAGEMTGDRCQLGHNKLFLRETSAPNNEQSITQVRRQIQIAACQNVEIASRPNMLIYLKYRTAYGSPEVRVYNALVVVKLRELMCYDCGGMHLDVKVSPSMSDFALLLHCRD
jgi:hypothetical protein